MRYKIKKIPKKNKEYRYIYIPNQRYMAELREEIPFLNEILNKHTINDVCYAFIKGKNCVLNSFQHIGYKYTLSIDIKNFFHSITKSHVKFILNQRIIDKCFVNNILPQGFPTSPVISNIAFCKVDNEIVNFIQKNFKNVIYTRYADDLIFSFNQVEYCSKLLFFICKILERNGFEVNKNKIKLQSSNSGRRIITGVGVDDTGLYPTRAIKKKIRASYHQKNFLSNKSLIEWSKCKLPK